MQVEQIDRDAAEYYGTALGYPEKDPSGDILRIAFARHREAVRAEQAAEIERLKSERDAAILQAQSWKAEAQAHKSTVHEAYQACTGATGEPGNWNGAQPVVNTLSEQAAELAKFKAQCVMLSGALKEIRRNHPAKSHTAITADEALRQYKEATQ